MDQHGTGAQNSGIIPPPTGLTGVLTVVSNLQNFSQDPTTFAVPAFVPRPAPVPTRVPVAGQTVSAGSMNQFLQMLMMAVLRNRVVANRSRSNWVSSDFLKIGKVTDNRLSKQLFQMLTARAATTATASTTYTSDTSDTSDTSGTACDLLTNAVFVQIDSSTIATSISNACQYLVDKDLYSRGSDSHSQRSENVIWTDTNCKINNI